MRRGAKALGLLILTAFAPVAAGNARALSLETLTTRDGLPQGTVMATLQDSQGFVWIGTEDGLVRFDGHDIYRYAYAANVKDGLPGNYVNAIVEDAHADLWVAIKGRGIAHWHRATDRFTVYSHDPRRSGSLCNDAVRTLLFDGRGRLWIGTSGCGVDILDPKSGAIEHVRHDPAREASLISDEVQSLFQDRDGRIWVGTRGGLDHWTAGSKAFVHVTGDDEAMTLQGKQVSSVTQAQDGSVWVATFDAGAFRLSTAGRIIAHYKHDAQHPESLANNDVRAILDDRSGHLWIGTADGLDLLDAAEGQFDHFRHQMADPESLNDSFVMSLYQDRSGMVWIGTRAGGVSRWNPHSWELGGSRPAWLDSKLVTAFADADNGRLWVASLGGGLVRVDVGTGEWSTFDDIIHRKNALGDDRVMSLLRDHSGGLWVGTMAAGLKFVTRDGEVRAIPVRPNGGAGVSAPGIMTLFQARSGLIWIGTRGGGANVLDPQTGVVRQLPYSADGSASVSAANVTAFTEDRDGNIWIGTDGGGLNLADSDGLVIRVFKHDVNDPGSLSANTVYSLATDEAGQVWIATDGGGLNRVTGSASAPAAISFKNYSHSTGLTSDTIYGVLSDDSGHLWLSGNAGLMRLDPRSNAVKTFHREHGLQGEEFNFGAYFRSSDGRLCFGGPGGFNVFSPSRLAESRAAPLVALTRVEILGAPLQSRTTSWQLKELSLDYRSSIVSFDFAALDFAAPDRNRLTYRMTGLTDHWIDLGNQRRVTLTNLPPGNHVLEVRGANADSVWSAQPLRLTIHQQAAPWRSRTAYVVYASVLLLFVLLVWLRQRRNLALALAGQQRLERQVAVRTRELSDSNQQLVNANEAKSSFLARMSHELRTPMNGVVGMAELLVRGPLSGAQARQIQTIRSSAQTLLKILNDLLDLSKAQAGKVQLESLPIDLTALLEECAALFTGAAETKGLSLTVCPPMAASSAVLGDALRLRQVVMNLIGNAVKFTEHGEVSLTCDVIPNGNEVQAQITVADSGIGISEVALTRIFDPFSQADETTTRRFGGTGLGLAICTELVAAMGGTITVQSTPGVGSTFRVVLPLKCNTGAATDEVPLAGTRVGVLTRSPSRQESLRRYLSSLGARPVVVEVLDAGAERDGVVIVDADTCAQALDACTAREDLQRLVLVGTSAAITRLHIEERLRAVQIVRQPVFREVLRGALESALGVSHERTMMRRALTAPAAHVLIVEDEQVNANVAEGYLTELGCTSVWECSGEAAVARAAVEHFDLIFMDLNMPGLDGYETTRRIRQSGPSARRAPIIALTANDAASHRPACLAAGMNDVMSKPYTLTQCASLLRRWSTAGREETSGGTPVGDHLSAVDGKTVSALRALRRSATGDLYARLVMIFQGNAPAMLSSIGAAVEAGDSAAAMAACHKFKSSAANVGALAFAELLGELEACAGSGDMAAARRLFERASVALPGLVQELTQFQLQASA